MSQYVLPGKTALTVTPIVIDEAEAAEAGEVTVRPPRPRPTLTNTVSVVKAELTKPRTVSRFTLPTWAWVLGGYAAYRVVKKVL